MELSALEVTDSQEPRWIGYLRLVTDWRGSITKVRGRVDESTSRDAPGEWRTTNDTRHIGQSNINELLGLIHGQK